jgi:predicted ferric reductase
LHISVQVTALVLLFFHHQGSRTYVLAALVIWVIDRILLRMIVSPVKVVADLKVAADEETVLLFCDIPVQKASSSQLRPHRNILQGWQPGQHVFVTIPTLGFEHKLQAHPFTIASPAPPTNHRDTWPLQLIIRAKDGFSKDLLNFAKSQDSAENSVEVILDGPYGSNDTLEALRTADHVFLFAGGSGITVTYPYAWTLLVRDEPQALMRQSIDSDVRSLVGDPSTAIEPDHHLFKQRDEGLHHLWVRSSRLH